jgi:hypothetical protein
MCAELSDADLNAIRKARGFSSAETAARSSFASFFVSSIGLQKVMESLTAEETATLHLLQQTGEVSISFFERLYGSDARSGQSYSGTYTQQFRPTFDAVKKNLVRKGLLIMAEVKTRAESVQMERWRYALPPEFEPYLPPLLEYKSGDQPGETSDAAVRKKLLQLVGGEKVIPSEFPEIVLKEGSIWLGQEPFSLNSLREWQMRTWLVSLGAFKPAEQTSLAATDAVLSLLNRLGPGQWASVNGLDPILRIFCFGGKIPPVEKMLQAGWTFGLLSRLKVGDCVYYRTAPPESLSASDDLIAPTWLNFTPPSGKIRIDLHQIPLRQLELLQSLVQLEVEDGVLYATPNLLKLGRTTPAQRRTSLAQYLAGELPAFQEALNTANQRWGKTLLHENLLVARVRDLSLRVQLERELGPDLVVLSEHFVAFPVNARASVEKILKKSGFVIKVV